VEQFKNLRNRLTMTGDNQLMLDSIPMVLMPRWFFVSIIREAEKFAGRAAAEKIYYAAGYDGAFKWAQTHIKKMNLSGKEVMEQYLGSAGLRGWGRFEILKFVAEEGSGLFRLYHSAVSEEMGNIGRLACIHLPGSLAGAFQAILDQIGQDLKVVGREISCRSKGDNLCEFVVEPG